MKIQKFSKKEAIKFGFEIAKKNLKFFILVLLFFYGITFGLREIGEFIEKKNFLVSLPFGIASSVFSMIFSLGLIKISLDFCDNKKPGFFALFSQYRLFFRYLFATILYNLISILGLFLFFIPGIIFAIRFSFYDYFLVDKNSGIVESLKRSWQITRGNLINLFLLYLLFLVINFFGFLALVIGLFLTLPITMVAEAFVYRKLLAFSESSLFFLGQKGQKK